MQYPTYLRAAFRERSALRSALLAMPFLCASSFAQVPSATANPATVPAGAIDALPPKPAQAAPAKPAKAVISTRQAREADDAYLAGAKEILHKDALAAERDFTRATQLNPDNRDYALALIVTRETHIAELVAGAARARLRNDDTKADALLAEARALDPTNPIVAQHFADVIAPPGRTDDNIGATLAGPIELAPNPGTHDFNLSGDAQSVLRQVYSAFGITTVFDPSVNSGTTIRFNMDAVNFADATHILTEMTHVFVVPVQAKSALIAHDAQENRDNLQPLVEETLYLPGQSQEQMTELANVARNIFDIKQVTASPTGGFMLLRGDEHVLDQLNATYADLLDAGSEVLFDVKLYEIDHTNTRQIGAQLPSGANFFSLTQAAQNLLNANQTLIQEAITSGALVLTTNANENELLELGVLIAAGVSGASQFTSLLGTLGTFDGLPLVGLALASTSTFYLLMQNTDARILDDIQLRSGNRQDATFKAGSRYPIVTATYSGGVSSGLASQLAGITINGQSASSLLSQYLGSSAALTVPQFQYEDLGVTLKMTPSILHSSEVQVKLELKIEALAGTSINSVPILNNRALTSTITVPAGQTAMLATLVDTNDVKTLNGLPGLSELPGFQGTDQNGEKDSAELLITITPHIVRSGSLHVASRRLASGRSGNNAPSQ